MVLITFQNLLDQLNLTEDTEITAEQAESLIDHAINKIIGYGRGQIAISNMQGTAGSKSLTVTQEEAGFIIEVASAIYKKDFSLSGNQSESVTLGPASYSNSSGSSMSSGGRTPNDIAKEAAMYLRELEVALG